jgi:hypothetical protein
MSPRNLEIDISLARGRLPPNELGALAPSEVIKIGMDELV